MLVNPFTGQVLNANPEGCNQHTGAECRGTVSKEDLEKLRNELELELKAKGKWGVSFEEAREQSEALRFKDYEGK